MWQDQDKTPNTCLVIVLEEDVLGDSATDAVKPAHTHSHQLKFLCLLLSSQIYRRSRSNRNSERNQSSASVQIGENRHRRSYSNLMKMNTSQKTSSFSTTIE